MKYEYKTMTSDTVISEEQANALGEEGWMLQSQIELMKNGKAQIAWYFMRVKEAN